MRGVVPDQTFSITDTQAIASGDTAPAGIKRIGGATSVVVHSPAGVNVAVIDTGIDLDHPDLNAVHGTNCVTQGASSDDDQGHGTHVAGTIGAKNNGSGVVGVAPGTTVYAVKVLNNEGSGSTSAIACGIDWVAANANALNIRVANMSLGGSSSGSYTCGAGAFGIIFDAMHRAICNATNAGVTFVVAAGNSNADQSGFVPAKYPQVLTVTAVSDTDGVGGGLGSVPSCRSGEADDRYASFSNYATTTSQQNHTIAAPGVCVHSTTMGGGYASNWSGTSMASPHVAGAVALCIKSGATNGPCAGLSPANVILKMRELALARTNEVPSHGFTGLSGRYYGNMAWIGHDLGTPPPTPDFTLTSSTGSQTVIKGTNAVYAVTINRTGGHTASVDLSVSGLPSGASASFSPDPTTGGSSTLTINTTNSATGGPVTLTIQGTDGTLNRTVQVTLTVNPVAQNPDFTLTASPTSVTVPRGTAATYVITVNPTGGFSNAVSFRVSGLGFGMGSTFTPPSSPTSTTLNVTSSSFWTSRGTRTLTITGTSGGVSRTVQVTLTLT